MYELPWKKDDDRCRVREERPEPRLSRELTTATSTRTITTNTTTIPKWITSVCSVRHARNIAESTCAVTCGTPISMSVVQTASALKASSTESVTVIRADWSPCGEVASRGLSRASTGSDDQCSVSRKTNGPDGPSVA